jgi:hypothetical protein
MDWGRGQPEDIASMGRIIGLSEWIGDAGSLRDIASMGRIIFVDTPRLLDAASSASSDRPGEQVRGRRFGPRTA